MSFIKKIKELINWAKTQFSSRKNHSKRDFSPTWLSWNRANKWANYTLFKAMVTYVTLSALFVNAIDILKRHGLGSYELPFHWKSLFAGAVIYLIGYIVYLWKCPKFIQEYPVFSAITGSSYTVADFREELEKLKDSNIDINGYEGAYHDTFITVLKGDQNAFKSAGLIDDNDECLKEIKKFGETKSVQDSRRIYNLIISSWSKSNYKLSGVVVMLFFVGFFAIFCTVLMNMKTVLTHLF